MNELLGKICLPSRHCEWLSRTQTITTLGSSAVSLGKGLSQLSLLPTPPYRRRRGSQDLHPFICISNYSPLPDAHSAWIAGGFREELEYTEGDGVHAQAAPSGWLRGKPHSCWVKAYQVFPVAGRSTPTPRELIGSPGWTLAKLCLCLSLEP